MSIQDVAGDAPVADLVAYVELSSIQDAFGWNSWVSTRATSQRCNMEEEPSFGHNSSVLHKCVISHVWHANQKQFSKL